MHDTAYPFPHRKLEVFQVSLEMVALAKKAHVSPQCSPGSSEASPHD